MSTIDYIPQPGSLVEKVLEFFTSNPDEELTPTEIGIKFDRPAKNIHSLLTTAVARGALVRKEGDDGELVYCLGAGSPAITPNPNAHPVLPKTGGAALQEFMGQTVKTPKARPTRQPLNLDLDALPIETSVPISQMGNNRHTMDWNRLFDRMQVGNSVVLPRSAHSRISKAKLDSKRAGGPEFSIRLIDANSLRLWRIK